MLCSLIGFDARYTLLDYILTAKMLNNDCDDGDFGG